MCGLPTCRAHGSNIQQPRTCRPTCCRNAPHIFLTALHAYAAMGFPDDHGELLLATENLQSVKSQQTQRESGVRGNVPAPFGAGKRLESPTYCSPTRRACWVAYRGCLSPVTRHALTVQGPVPLRRSAFFSAGARPPHRHEHQCTMSRTSCARTGQSAPCIASSPRGSSICSVPFPVGKSFAGRVMQ